MHLYVARGSSGVDGVTLSIKAQHSTALSLHVGPDTRILTLSAL